MSVAPLNLSKRCSLETEVFRRDIVSAQFAVSELSYLALSGYGYLIESVAAVHNKRPGAAQLA